MVITNEAWVSKLLRIEHGFSSAQVASKLGLSEGLIAAIETGGGNGPEGKRLEGLREVHGGIKVMSFVKRVRRFDPTLTKKQEATEILERLTNNEVSLALPMLKALLGASR